MVGADIGHTRRTGWCLPHASGRQQYCGADKLSCTRRRGQQDYVAHMLSFSHTLSLSLSLVRPAPSPIKGDALSPKKGTDGHSDSLSVKL